MKNSCWYINRFSLSVNTYASHFLHLSVSLMPLNCIYRICQSNLSKCLWQTLWITTDVYQNENNYRINIIIIWNSRVERGEKIEWRAFNFGPNSTDYWFCCLEQLNSLASITGIKWHHIRICALENFEVERKCKVSIV